MNLNYSKWKSYLLSKYFDVKAGIYHYPEEYDDGKTPYISASNENNGIIQYIDLVPDFKGNCIVTGKIGCTAFYQKDDFCASSDVNVFIPKNFKLNEQIGLFLTTVINFSENYKWSYGRQCRVGDSNEIIVKLPSTNIGEPDWHFMEAYIKSIKSKRISTRNTQIGNYQLGTDKWAFFKVSDLFEVKYGINMELDTCIQADKYDPKAINFVARTENNNGVTGLVKIVDGKIPHSAGLITCAGGGSVLSTFVQTKPFYSGRDLYLLIPKKDMSIYLKLFIITLIKSNKYRYSYGRQANVTLPNLILKLPTNEKKQLDVKFMEEYIKKLAYADKIIVNL
jgi:hypothetical protein